MRLAVIGLLALTGCPRDTSGDYGYIPPGGYVSDGCRMDSDCGSDVCARDGECLRADEVQPIRVTWTINGQAADEITCANGPDWFVDFNDTYNSGFGFAPVPCRAGVFSVDKMPIRFFQVEIGVDNAGALASGPFDDQGHVTFDVSL